MEVWNVEGATMGDGGGRGGDGDAPSLVFAYMNKREREPSA